MSSERREKDLEWLKIKIANRKASSRAMGVQLSLEHAERLAKRIEDLEFMRGIAGDVLAHLQSHVPVPWFMRRAFADALAFRHDKQSTNEEDG